MFEGNATPDEAEDSPSGSSLCGPHRLAAAAVGARLWTYRYLLGYRPARSSDHRTHGNLLHKCYQYYYASLMPTPPGWFRARTLRDSLEEDAADYAPPKRREIIDKVLTNLAEYMEHYKADRGLLTPLYIENEFQAQIGELDPGGPWPELDKEIVTCRTDLVYELATTPERWIWANDYKSLGRSRVNQKTGLLLRWNPNNEYALDWQTLLNLAILRLRLGPRVRGITIERTTREPAKMTGRYDFDRNPLVIPHGAYAEVGRMARGLVKREIELIEQYKRGEEPFPCFHACYGRFGPCDFREACLADNREARMAILNDPTMFKRIPAAELDEMHRRLARGQRR